MYSINNINRVNNYSNKTFEEIKHVLMYKLENSK